MRPGLLHSTPFAGPSSKFIVLSWNAFLQDHTIGLQSMVQNAERLLHVLPLYPILIGLRIALPGFRAEKILHRIRTFAFRTRRERWIASTGGWFTCERSPLHWLMYPGSI